MAHIALKLSNTDKPLTIRPCASTELACRRRNDDHICYAPMHDSMPHIAWRRAHLKKSHRQPRLSNAFHRGLAILNRRWAPCGSHLHLGALVGRYACLPAERIRAHPAQRSNTLL